MTMDTQQQAAGMKTAASLALITILGPSAIDMYLAAMPRMTQDLNTDYATMQLTLTVFLLAMGAGQLVFGPVIDALGRRRPLMAGLLVFILASLWAAVSTSMDTMLSARFFQGLSAALVLVTAMSSVRDLASGARATQLFALLVTIQGAAPILAPAVGGVIDMQFGWRAVMLALAIVGALALANSSVNLPETLIEEKRVPLKLDGVFRTYWHLLADPRFIVPALALSAVFFFLFGYVGGASYVYQTGYGLRSDVFGFVFGGTGAAMMLGAMGSSRLARTRPAGLLALLGVAIMGSGAALALLAALAGAGLYGIVPGLFIAMFGLGMAEPPLMSIAMASQERALGATAALLGAGTHILGSLATPLAGALAPVGAHAWLGFLLVAALAAMALALVSVRRVVPKKTAVETAVE
ncbi:multidrug effflux MFS transporter [Thauera linaloolentis]|uniref:Bcr/CflA family efflux transporter n=1 Tax=Thauera linaloolentis (strain DSM 12138 / JCM 21573 / CCUG 41526 / CIP 105981 / IAM 15112 / NBRC 102519 / 47Lol) TaxID=1123367 RepID=N6YCW2_THAL4|nr:multidrug effflux MFS transporter [Thauera linaloolentis]ENO89345.1 drug resistance transporter [Thauera linaloolentis 47Lol = DSM 12138]MCM8565006.1 multidrug effflux MFS transporter [Thauera linaloolentis]